MAGIEWVASNIVTPRSPKRDWSGRLGIPGTKRPLSTPERQERAGYAPPGRTVRLIVLGVESCGSSIFLTNSVCVGGIAKSLDIGRTHLRRKHREDGKPVDTAWVVKSHAIGDTTATIMPSDREARKPKPLHDDHHVLRHGSLRIGRMIRSGNRATTASVAAKVGADDGKIAGKHGRDAAPHQVCLRKAVQQENWRPGSGPADEDAGLTRLDLGSLEVVQHLEPCSLPRIRATIYGPHRHRHSMEDAFRSEVDTSRLPQ